MIRLRPHHLLCMLTYAGRGYTPRFTSGMDDLITRLGKGEEITIINGPDDICAPWLSDASGDADHRQPHCHEPRITGRDERAAADVSALLGRKIANGSRLLLDAALLQTLRQAYRTDAIRSGCQGCEWKSFCDALSAGDFAGCRLQVG